MISMDDTDYEKIRIPSIKSLEKELIREEAKYNFRKSLIGIVAVLIVAAAAGVLMATRLFVMIRVNGNGMTPALADNEIIVIRQTDNYEIGDIVGFYYEGKILLERAISSEGDEIEIDEKGNVYVNGEMIDEPYLGEKSMEKSEMEFSYQVPRGRIFMLGDNRTESLDSRTESIGSVEKDQIIGKAVFRAWPLARIGTVN